MELFDMVFNRSTLYNTNFVDVKYVLKYPTLDVLRKENKVLYDYYKNRYDFDQNRLDDVEHLRYGTNMIKVPEYCKVVSISFGDVYVTNEGPKRNFKVINDDDEFIMIRDFFDFLNQISPDTKDSNNGRFLCGYDFKYFQIPLLIKKFLEYRGKLTNLVKFPMIFKQYLGNKPWDTTVIDIVDVWKFNGMGNAPIELISEVMGFNNEKEILTPLKISDKYWSGEINKNIIGEQSAVMVNNMMRIIKELTII